jgi:hypothetical protein
MADDERLCRPILKRERYEQKFGGKERVVAMEKAMGGRGKEVGINLCVLTLSSSTTEACISICVDVNYLRVQLLRWDAEANNEVCFFHW